MTEPMFTYAIDPSTVATGIALFAQEELIRVTVLEAEGLDYMIEAVRGFFHGVGPAHAVVETPISYRGDPRPNDILKVAVVAGACRAHFRTSTGVSPSGWNHGRPKKITQARISELLSPEQRDMITAIRAGIRGNAWDAVGIGLHHLGVLK